MIFDTPETINGSFGTATGTIGAYNVELKFSDSNTNLVLEVIPEPRTWALLGIGLAVAFARMRRRK